MKTDNSNLSSECLQGFAENEANAFYDPNNTSLWDTSDATQWKRKRENIIMGGNWQKKQDAAKYKDLIQSHAELLAALKTIVFIGDMSERYESSKRIVEKANSIINSLK